MFEHSEFKDSVSIVFNKLFGRISGRIILLGFLYAIVSTLISFFILRSLGAEQIMSMSSIDISEVISDPEAFLEEYSSTMEGFRSFGFFITILSLFIQSWLLNLYFTISGDAVHGDERTLSQQLGASFNRNILRIFLAFLLLGIITMVLMMMTGMIFIVISQLSSIIAVLGFIVLFIVLFILLMRFAITPAAITLGGMSPVEAIQFSWNKITFRRGGMLLLLGIAIMIAFAIVSFLVTLVLGLIPQESTWYVITTQVSGGVIGAVLTAAVITGLTILYFRYVDGVDEDSDSSEHLVIEDSPEA